MASYSVGLPAGIAAAGSRRHLDVLDQLGEVLTPAGIDDRLLVLGGGPLGMAAHAGTTSFTDCEVRSTSLRGRLCPTAPRRAASARRSGIRRRRASRDARADAPGSRSGAPDGSSVNTAAASTIGAGLAGAPQQHRDRQRRLTEPLRMYGRLSGTKKSVAKFGMRMPAARSASDATSARRCRACRRTTRRRRIRCGAPRRSGQPHERVDPGCGSTSIMVIGNHPRCSAGNSARR